MFDQLAKQVLGSGIQKILGGKPEDNTERNLRLGNSLDISNQKEMFDYRIDQGMSHGMTPYEMFMGPAAGAGGGTTGSGQVLGNSANQKYMQQKQQNQELQQKNMDRVTALSQTKMQTDTQKQVAEIQAGVSTRGQDMDYAIKTGQLDLSNKTFNQVSLPKAAAELKITEQELNVKLNQVVTSSPKFLKMMKIMTMGVSNSTNMALQSMLGIDITDPKSFNKLSDDQKKKILTLFLAYDSNALREFKGMQEYGTQSADTLGNMMKESIKNNKPKFNKPQGGSW